MQRGAVVAMSAAFAVQLVATATPLDARPKWDQAANVRAAATRLAEMQKRQGAEAVVKFLDACYRTHTLASQFSEALEGCLAQDLMFSHVLANIYARLPSRALKEQNLPSPQQISASVSKRVAAVATQYKLTEEQRKSILAAVETHGLPIFMKSVFPTAENRPPAKDNGGRLPAPPAAPSSKE